ncbi:MAG: hypothetical protein CXR31_12605 [Geobacter sp.]|nr:MAG: hypothetical protein CXR31_12605 [Geobacter sp.]
MRKLLIVMVVCAFGFASLDLAVAAEDNDAILKKIDALEQQLKELKGQQQASSEKESHCMRAFGREKFCKCIAENLPREVGLEQYVHTVITPKEGLGYDGLTPEQKKSVDQTLAARDKCSEKGGSFLW